MTDDNAHRPGRAGSETDNIAQVSVEAIARELSETLDLAPVIVRDLDGTIRVWGTGPCELYGYHGAEAAGQCLHELLQTAFPKPLHEIQAELLKHGRWKGELRHRHKDGSEVVVASVWMLRRDSSGEVRAVVEVNNDVTEARRAEWERLRLAAIVESSDDAIVSKTLDGTVTSWNPGAERMLGYSAAEMLGRRISILAPPGLEDDMPRILARIRRGETVDHYETCRRRKDGAIIEVSVTVSPIRDASGTIIGASKIARGIAEQKRSEAALRESEQRFRTLLENSPQMMWVNQADGTAEYFNAACRDYLGEALSRPGSAWIEAVHPDDRVPFLEARARAIAAQVPYNVEYRLRSPDGAYRWHAARIAPLRRGGAIEAWVGTAADIDEIRRMTAVLEKRVEERTRRLAEANAELEAFSYSVAHDLRAPLRSMRGFSQALLEDYADQLDETGRDFAGRIIGGADRLDRLIDDLLAYSRLTREGIRPERIDTAKIVREVLDQMQGTIAERGAGVAAEGTLPPVLGQRSILQQVMLNLIGNAIKFVAADTRPYVRVLARRTHGRVRICVEDNGIGFDPRHADRVFKVFERLHGPASPYPGTGIGLAIVRKGVERLGGRVGVRTAPGQGSCFWFELPSVED